jgi:hypothetical protein
MQDPRNRKTSKCQVPLINPRTNSKRYKKVKMGNKRFRLFLDGGGREIRMGS